MSRTRPAFPQQITVAGKVYDVFAFRATLGAAMNLATKHGCRYQAWGSGWLIIRPAGPAEHYAPAIPPGDHPAMRDAMA